MKRRSSHTAAVKFDRYFLFFAKLDVMFPDSKSITSESLLDELGLDGLRRNAVCYGFLAKREIISVLDESRIEEAREHSRQKKLIVACEGKWFEKDIDGFIKCLRTVSKRFRDRGWTGTRARKVERTITASLRAAVLFFGHLDSCNVHSSSQLHQDLVDSFIYENAGYANSLRSLIKYLNREGKTFRKLRVNRPSGELRSDLFLSQQRYGELIKSWLAVDDQHAKEGIICLFMILYAQPAKKIVRLRLSDLERGTNGIYRVCFGSAEIPLDRRLSDLLDRHIQNRTALAVMEDDWDNAYLFTGRKYGSHLSSASVTSYLLKHQVTADQLFASSIYFAYQSGMKQPKVLVRGFGITDATAIKYLKIIDPRMYEEAEKTVYSRRAY